MLIQGFQPDAALSTALWRFQNTDSLGNVTTEWYVDFSVVKWFKTNRAVAPVVGGQQDQIKFWFNPKQQNDDPDLTLSGPPATAMLANLDAIWSGSGSTTGFQPDSAIDAAFWRWQYTNAAGTVVNETYLNFGLVKWATTRRVVPPVVGGQSDLVSLWFNNKDQDLNPDLVLDGAVAMKLLSDLDAVWTN